MTRRGASGDTHWSSPSSRMSSTQRRLRTQTARWVPWVGVGLLVIFAACTQQTGIGQLPGPAFFGPKDCSKPSPVHLRHPGFVDVGVVTEGGTARAVVMAGRPFPAKTDIKIVWRLTGAGSLSLFATGGSRTLHPAQLGEHIPSLEGRGREWGSVFRFPEAGCYVVHADRGGVSAYTKIAIQ
jgi:hypothetical protein